MGKINHLMLIVIWGGWRN